MMLLVTCSRLACLSGREPWRSLPPTRIYEERIQRGHPPTVDRTIVHSSTLTSLLYSGMALEPDLRPQDAETFKKLLVDACRSQVARTSLTFVCEHVYLPTKGRNMTER